MPASQSVVLSPDEGEVFSVGPFHILARVLGGQANGAFELYELTLGPSTIDYHVHRTMDETLCVVAGEVEFVVEGKRSPRPAGSVAFVPRGLHHGFTNHGPGPARLLILFNPSRSQHEYFRELETLFATTPLDAPALQALQQRYDQELVPLNQ
jgi:quercetin dioxygenase-like cupin family protein